MIKAHGLELTKEQVVDYMYKNFTFDGGMTKTRLKAYSDEILTRFMNEKCTKERIKQYLEEAKYLKYFVDVEENGKAMAYDMKAKDENHVREIFKEENPNAKIVKISTQKGNHRCKYCSSICSGTNKDLLCDDCHETFGHMYYSEL